MQPGGGADGEVLLARRGKEDDRGRGGLTGRWAIA